MLVEVPMRVTIPPAMAANESGMSSFEGASPTSRAHCFTRGANMATMGVLFRKAERKEVESISRTSAPRSRPRGEKTSRSMKPRAFASCTPAATTNSAATVSTAGFAKPAKACSGVRMPASNNSPRLPSRTMSGRATSRTSSPIMPTSTPTVNQASQPRASISLPLHVAR
ncbi:MAG: hypothetical protein KatS3mg043_1731 [Rhodothermaceae bacterium]|nr:MAG: hypothetical protein KatS3mg043_1731 [Rhodothermaceae bacterium]